METKQTAVDWVFDMVIRCYDEEEWLRLYEQAKAMEKEQIGKAYESGCIGEVFELNCNHSSEQYYNENYGK